MKLKHIYEAANKEVKSILNKMNVDKVLIKKVIENTIYLSYFVPAINYSNINFYSIFKNEVKRHINTLCIAPCSFYIDIMLPYIKNYFNRIILVDNFRKGSIEGIPIIKEDIVNPNKVDLFYISSLTDRITEHFKDKFRGYPQITIKKLFKILLEKDVDLKCNYKIIHKILNENKSNDVFFIFGFFLEQLIPTIKLLKKNGFNVIIIVNNKKSFRHGKEVMVNDILKDERIYCLSLGDIFFLINHLSKGLIFIVSNLLGLSGYNIESVIILNTLLTKKHIPVIFLMLDVIWPHFGGMKNSILYDKNKEKIQIDDYKFFEIAYKQALSKSDMVILNANTNDCVEFLKNTLQKSNIFSFYRYTFYNTNLEFIPKSSKEYHIAVINSIFSTYNNDMMRNVVNINLLKKILDQKIHVHKFSAREDIEKINELLSAEQRKFFHGEEVVFDQMELINKLSKYDCGWMIHDSMAIADPIFNSSSQFLKELYFLFNLTTVPTTVLTFCAAGVPVLINRSMKGLLEEFPKEFFIPLEVSEVGSLKKILERANLSERKKICFQKRRLFSIEERIGFLLNLLKKLRCFDGLEKYKYNKER